MKPGQTDAVRRNISQKSRLYMLTIAYWSYCTRASFGFLVLYLPGSNLIYIGGSQLQRSTGSHHIRINVPYFSDELEGLGEAFGFVWEQEASQTWMVYHHVLSWMAMLEVPSGNQTWQLENHHLTKIFSTTKLHVVWRFTTFDTGPGVASPLKPTQPFWELRSLKSVASCRSVCPKKPSLRLWFTAPLTALMALIAVASSWHSSCGVQELTLRGWPPAIFVAEKNELLDYICI